LWKRAVRLARSWRFFPCGAAHEQLGYPLLTWVPSRTGLVPPEVLEPTLRWNLKTSKIFLESVGRSATTAPWRWHPNVVPLLVTRPLATPLELLTGLGWATGVP
jgi:hypothetical protein